ncbi:MAG: phospholipase D-like domain-containing protein [Bacteroidota bacterium]|nr:phospholipase D-like domain-containing protein [Bacteroidota bacterium]
MKYRILSFVFISFIMLLIFPLSSILAQGTITAVQIPTAIAGGGGAGTLGYPYAVYVQIQGWTAGANGQAYLKLYTGSFNEYMWSATSVWSNTTTYGDANQPKVDIDASGNWSGWIYAKHNDALGSSVLVRARKIPTSPTVQLTTSSIALTILNMSTTGGWIVKQTSTAVNKGIITYSGGAVVGSYRSEDNLITEGYTYGAGGFKVAVPAGTVDSLVALNDDGSRFQTFVGPWTVSAGQETEAGNSGGTVGKGSATIEPTAIQGAIPGTLTLKLAGDAPDTITKARIHVPSSWSWSQSMTDVSIVGGGAPSANVSGDTIEVSTLTLIGTDTMKLTITNLIPYDSTGYFTFLTETGLHSDTVSAIATQPKIFVYSTPIPIAIAKENDALGVPLLNNALITVRGVVTSGNQLGAAAYIQDNSGGMVVYGSSFSSAVTIGDEVIVSGLVQPFYGLFEIVNPMLHSIISQGNPVEPLVVTTSQIAKDGIGGVEVYEGSLVRINSVTVTDTFNVAIPTWAVTGSGTNYRLHDATGYIVIRVSPLVEFANQPAPQKIFDVIGVVSQFKYTAPYIGGYQLMPRFLKDIIATGPIIATMPEESNLQPTSLIISWATLYPGTTEIRYGKTNSYELGFIKLDDSLRLNHSIALSGLIVATIYNIQAFSTSGTDTSFAGNLIVSTTSASPTTGQINVYFNKSINSSVSIGEVAQGNVDFVAKLVSRISNAKQSIDLALYSLSGTVGANVASALVFAKQRGVKVRVIGEYDNRTTVPWSTLASNGIPVIYDMYGANDGSGLHHNKFIVIDYRGGAAESVWVWTGSTNFTDPGITADRQNVIEIQDVALAGAFTAEFEEMWGSKTETPNSANSRFGARKQNNTPHKFVVGGKNIECYFSPSDRTTYYIGKTLGKAQGSINTAILTFTRKELADSIINKKKAGRKTRVVMDNNTDLGNQYSYLQSNSVDVLLKGGSGMLHHKYAIVDAEPTGRGAYVITGSHNWSSSAETRNDENTLIIQDDRIGNLYLQEFLARYLEAGGSDPVVVGVEKIDNEIPASYSLSQNYPNPFNPTTDIRYQISDIGFVSIKIYDILGREITTLVNEVKQPGTYEVTWDASASGGFASGVYYYKIQVNDPSTSSGHSFVDVKKMLLLR